MLKGAARGACARCPFSSPAAGFQCGNVAGTEPRCSPPFAGRGFFPSVRNRRLLVRRAARIRPRFGSDFAPKPTETSAERIPSQLPNWSYFRSSKWLSPVDVAKLDFQCLFRRAPKSRHTILIAISGDIVMYQPNRGILCGLASRWMCHYCNNRAILY